MQRRPRKPRVSMCDTENGGARNWSELPTEEWDRIIDLYEARDTIALAREAKRLGTSVSTLERQVRHAILVRDRYRQKYLVESVPESKTPVYDEYHVIKTNDAIIISDLEVPDHDAWMLKAALLTGMRYGIRTCIFAGDLIATDQEALNTWLSTWAEDFGSSSYRADLDELRQIIRRFQEWFTDGIYMVMGNHDLRIDKKTGGQVTLEMLLDDTDMQFSRYSYMYIWMPKLQEWVYVCHQFNYSRTSVKLAQDVWNVVSAPDGYDNATGERIPGYDEWSDGKNKQKCHVLVTHTHVAQDGFSPDGNWRTIGMGCMRDDKRTKYKRARATKFPEWNQGFVMLRDGFFRPLTKSGTDWRTVLGDEYYAMLMGSRPEFSALYASDSNRHFREETCEIDQSSALRKQRWTSTARRHLSVIMKGYTPRSTPLAVLASRPKDSAMVGLIARRKSCCVAPYGASAATCH